MPDPVRLGDLARARSGDKGNHANIGVIARSEQAFAHLDRVLTAECVRDHFAALAPSRVERFKLPGIRAFNFVLHDVLAGGASRSLRIDAQGKALALALLELPLPPPGEQPR